ncbi:MAG: glycosyl transferase [Bacteroidota bacterium]|nr:glycosyl transferase [Bacteroidota bacterium]
MKINFTICSNNYLAHAKILGASLKKSDPSTSFFIFLCDKKNKEIDYDQLADEVIPINEIEPQLPALALKYNIVELNTSVKPRVFEYLLKERNASKVLFFDPDIKIYNSISFLFDELESCSVILVPHICTPIPMDQKTPSENHFLNFGIYNLGFIGLRNSAKSLRFISWWKDHTYKQGYVDVYKGIFVDQLPINLAPVFFEDVKIMKNRGLNMAPWNLHERYLNNKDGRYFVNGKDELIFYHFSSFKVDVMELPVSQYNRFSLKDRRDLQNIYKKYNHDLKIAGYNFYKNIICSYSPARKKYLKKVKQNKWIDKILLKKFFSR